MRRVVSVLALLVLAGCSSTQTYPGESRDASQVARIVPETRSNRSSFASATGEVRVRVNGEQLDGLYRSFEVLPGRQQLQVVYLDDETPLKDKVLRTRAVVLPLDAQAGRTYGVRGRATWAEGRPTVTLWAVDGTDGRTVSSVVVPAASVVLQEQWRDFEWDE